jgi:hypothetical protein
MLNYFLTKTLIEIAEALAVVSSAQFCEATLSSFVLFGTIITVDYEMLEVVVDAPDHGVFRYFAFGSLDEVKAIRERELEVLRFIREFLR